MSNKPIVIVGAGPAGATLALLLVKRQIPVVLIEASRNFQRVFRGEGLMPSGLDAIEAMGLMDLLDRIPHQPLTSWEFWVEGVPFFSVDEPMGSDRPCTLVSQPHFLDAVIAEVQQYEGFEFIQGETLQDVVWRGDRITGVKLGDRTIEAALVIGCDGRASGVRSKAKLDLVESGAPFNLLWFKFEQDLEQELAAIGSNPFAVYVQGETVFSLFRGAENQWQVGWVLDDPGDPDWKSITDWRSTLATAAPPVLAKAFHNYPTAIDRPILLTVRVGLAPQWSRPGGLLLGDAAHPMSPIRAQGINMALRDAIVADREISQAWFAGDRAEGLELRLDRAIQAVQAAREPEIRTMQALQAAEAHDAAKLHNSAFLRQVIKTIAPLLGPVIRIKWIHRQKTLRHGLGL